MAGNVPGYEEPQCFMVEDEDREAALQTMMAFVEHLKNRRASRRIGMAKLCTTLKPIRRDLGSLLPTVTFASQCVRVGAGAGGDGGEYRF